jgi:hypothetical protein
MANGMSNNTVASSAMHLFAPDPNAGSESVSLWNLCWVGVEHRAPNFSSGLFVFVYDGAYFSLSLHLYYHALVVGDDVVVFGVVFHIMHAIRTKRLFHLH